MSVGLLFSSVSLAQSPSTDDLAVGRQLFAEGLDDEDHKRFEAALEKFRRVLRIRDTAPVRYRIAVNLEALGKIKEALENYGAVVRLGTAGAAGSADANLVRAAQARIDALEPKVAHLAVRLSPQAGSDAEVLVDDTAVPQNELGDVRVDPGRHVVQVKASGDRTARVEVSLSEGGRAEIPIVLESARPPPPPPPPPPSGTSLRTVGVITGAGGAVLLVGGAVVLALRSSAISELEEACPQGNCPVSRERELRDTRDRAVVEGPVGGALLGVGALAVGAGIVLFTIGGKDATASARLVPAPTRSGMGLTLMKTF